jgi:hypothetical protein
MDTKKMFSCYGCFTNGNQARAAMPYITMAGVSFDEHQGTTCKFCNSGFDGNSMAFAFTHKAQANVDLVKRIADLEAKVISLESRFA